MTGNVMEVVKTVCGSVVYDEFDDMGQCPCCGADVGMTWRYCNCCGEELGGDIPAFPTCSNVGDQTVFECSACGRKYIPAQIRDRAETGLVEWNSCPGCCARVV